MVYKLRLCYVLSAMCEVSIACLDAILGLLLQPQKLSTIFYETNFIIF